MSFLEVRFPDDISWGATGGSTYRTTVIEAGGGHEQRNIDWEKRRGKWNVAHGAQTKAQMDILIEFFNAMRGKAHGFRFRDWTDYEAEEELFGEGDNVEDEFQLIKTYTIADGTTTESYVHTVSKPCQGMIRIFIDAILQTEGVDYTIDYLTGLVTFTAPPSGVGPEQLTWTGEFDVPVRFDTDQLEVSLDFEDLESWEVRVVEIRV